MDRIICGDAAGAMAGMPDEQESMDCLVDAILKVFGHDRSQPEKGSDET